MAATEDAGDKETLISFQDSQSSYTQHTPSPFDTTMSHGQDGAPPVTCNSVINTNQLNSSQDGTMPIWAVSQQLTTSSPVSATSTTSLMYQDRWVDSLRTHQRENLQTPASFNTAFHPSNYFQQQATRFPASLAPKPAELSYNTAYPFESGSLQQNAHTLAQTAPPGTDFNYDYNPDAQRQKAHTPTSLAQTAPPGTDFNYDYNPDAQRQKAHTPTSLAPTEPRASSPGYAHESDARPQNDHTLGQTAPPGTSFISNYNPDMQHQNAHTPTSLAQTPAEAISPNFTNDADAQQHKACIPTSLAQTPNRANSPGYSDTQRQNAHTPTSLDQTPAGGIPPSYAYGGAQQQNFNTPTSLVQTVAGTSFSFAYGPDAKQQNAHTPTSLAQAPDGASFQGYAYDSDAQQHTTTFLRQIPGRDGHAYHHGSRVENSFTPAGSQQQDYYTGIFQPQIQRDKFYSAAGPDSHDAFMHQRLREAPLVQVPPNDLSSEIPVLPAFSHQTSKFGTGGIIRAVGPRSQWSHPHCTSVNPRVYSAPRQSNSFYRATAAQRAFPYNSQVPHGVPHHLQLSTDSYHEKQLNPSDFQDDVRLPYQASAFPSILVLSNVPDAHNELSLKMLIEDALENLKLKDDSFELKSHNENYQLTFSKPFDQKELDDVINLLEEENITANYIKPSICVEFIENKKFLNERALRHYFGSANRSGGGPIESICGIEDGKPVITFETLQVLTSVLNKDHTKNLGPNVRLTVIINDDSSDEDDESSDSDESQSSTESKQLKRKIIVSGIKKSMRNEKSLKAHFQQLGVGKVEKIDCKDKDAVITFEHPIVIQRLLTKNHSQLGKKVVIGTKDDPEIPQGPCFYSVEATVAKYLQLNQAMMDSALSQFQVKTLVDVSNNRIVLTPTTSSLPNWQDTCKETLQTFFSNKVVFEKIRIEQEVRSDVFSIVMTQNELCHKLDSSGESVTVAGDATVVASLVASIDELYATAVTRTTSFPFESFASLNYFKGCKLKMVQAQYPNMTIVLDENNHCLNVDGCTKDLEELQRNFPEFCDHIHVPLKLEEIELRFLSRVSNDGFIIELADLPVVPYFHRSQQSGVAERFSFLCSCEDKNTAQTVAQSLRDKIVKQSKALPQSFKPGMITRPNFQDLMEKLQASHVFEYEFQNNSLIVVGMCISAKEVSQSLVCEIQEMCAITEELLFNNGEWRLITTHDVLKNKWANCLDAISGMGVTILGPNVVADNDPIVKLKGEPDLVTESLAHIKKLQSSVIKGSFTCERPGLLKFFKETQGQTVLKGIEATNNVCIEMVKEKPVVAMQEKPANFNKVCSAITLEHITVQVLIGDITSFNRADVIVNAANELLQHGGGVAQAICKKGGPEIQRDSNKYIERKGKVITGTAVLLTETGTLPPPYKAIVHAVGPRWNANTSEHKKLIAVLKSTCKQALTAAESYGSIAIPAISSGVFGFPLDICADTLLKAVVEFSAAAKKSSKSQLQLNTIYFIIFKENDAQHFLTATKKHLPKDFVANTHTKSAHSSLKGVHEIKTITPKIRKKKMAQATTSSSTARYQSSSLQNIKITNGNIEDAQVDALVNSTNNNLGFDSAVSKALLKAGGDSYKKECAKRATVSVATGGIAVTGAGDLKCKHVIHVVLPKYNGNESIKILRNVVHLCLKECTKLGLNSIAFPSIGAGVLNYPKDVVASCLLQECASYFDNNQGKTSLKQVQFVIYLATHFQEFQQQFTSLNFPVPSISGASPAQEFLQLPTHKNEFNLTQKHCLVILKGDISENDSHVIVNTTNRELVLDKAGAVSKAISKKGGFSLQAACSSALGQRMLVEGEALITGATGALNCREVFHIVFHSNDDEMFIKTILACLTIAEERKHQSIAFPAIGTGIGGYPCARAVEGMIKALKKFIEMKPTHLTTIRMILFQKELYKEFLHAFQAIGKADNGGWWHNAVTYVTTGAGAAAKAVKEGFQKLANWSLEDEIAEHFLELEREQECILEVAPVNEDALVFSIYGGTKADVESAEQKIQDVLKSQFISDEIDQEEVGCLNENQILSLKKQASENRVKIEFIIEPPELHTIRLHGCLNDVLLMTVIITNVLSNVKQEKTRGKAAEVFYKHIRWTWQNEFNEHIEYDEKLNYEIEEAYLQGSLTFTTKEGGFTIDFNSMVEINTSTNAAVKVKRNDLSQVERPKEWEPMPKDLSGSEVRTQLILLKPGCREYDMVKSEFEVTMVAGTNFTQIISIERVQNPVLYGQYMARKKEMEMHNPKNVKNERRLFHGTTADTIPKINTQGFNRAFCGKNAVVYGQGVYFARDASYSDRYADPDDKQQRRMYLAQVLTGEYVKVAKR